MEGGSDVNGPIFRELVLETQKELAKTLQNLDAEDSNVLALQRKASGMLYKPPNYVLKERRNRDKNVRNQGIPSKLH